MSALGRRELLRMAAPAVALPMVAAIPAGAEEVRLVTRDEIMEAFRFYDGMELQAGDLNLRYQILIDMLFETNPEALRIKLQQLVDNRKDRLMLVDPDTAQTAPFDPSMYDAIGNLNVQREQELRQEVATDFVQARIAHFAPKSKLRTRVAAWLLGWRG